MNNIGFGDSQFKFAVYIANKPNMFEYNDLSSVTPLGTGEVNAINQCCGNGWRKVFNVYAKVLFALNPEQFDYSTKAATWQSYRDNYLLQPHSELALLFTPPILNSNSQNSSQNSSQNIVHIICGKSHAKQLIKSGLLLDALTWLNEEFAIDHKNNVIICPYFDYRQLSNIKIERLARLITSLL